MHYECQRLKSATGALIEISRCIEGLVPTTLCHWPCIVDDLLLLRVSLRCLLSVHCRESVPKSTVPD